MKLSYSEQIIPGLTLGDVMAYSRTTDLSLLKGHDPIDIALKLFEKDSLSQPGWEALMHLDFARYNKKRAKAYKKVFNDKYGYIVKNLQSHTDIALASPSLLDGIQKCLKENSELPYYEEFYKNYFLVYNIDSIIDLAYTLPEKKKEMCKTLLVASCQWYRDNGFQAESSYAKQKKQEGKTIELSNAYLDVRYKAEIWSEEDKVVEYLMNHYAEDIKNASFPMEGFLAIKKKEKKLKRDFKGFNVGAEKYRFLKLAQKAQAALTKPKDTEEIKDDTKIISESADKSAPVNVSPVGVPHIGTSVTFGSTSVHDTTNIDVLDTPIEETAEEVTMSITTPHETRTKQKAAKEKVRWKENIDYAEQQRISQKIGDRGEELVLMSEIQKVKEWGLPAEMVEQVRRVSLESDDYGFDILSFDKDGNERYLEVKSTKQSKKDFSFILTRNEFEHAKAYGNNYSFVIVFDILNQPRIWYMGNPFLKEPYKVNIQPTQYRVDVSTTEL